LDEKGPTKVGTLYAKSGHHPTGAVLLLISGVQSTDFSRALLDEKGPN